MTTNESCDFNVMSSSLDSNAGLEELAGLGELLVLLFEAEPVLPPADPG